jgi:hypothetical protein
MVGSCFRRSLLWALVSLALLGEAAGFLLARVYDHTDA